jgi:hypothetical protein
MSVLVSHYLQASNDALTTGQTLHDTARQLHNDCTTTTDNSVISHFTPETLTSWADAERQAEKAYADMVRYMQCRNNVLLREYAHKCLTALRNVVARVMTMLQTLRQLSATFDLVATSAPPGQLFAPCVLATCSASNAPGLSPIAMNYWQVRLKE